MADEPLAVGALRAIGDAMQSAMETPDAPPHTLPKWPFDALGDLGARVRTADEKLAAVQALIDHAHKISPSDRMVVYVGDLEHALGLRDERARTRTGSGECVHQWQDDTTFGELPGRWESCVKCGARRKATS